MDFIRTQVKAREEAGEVPAGTADAIAGALWGDGLSDEQANLVQSITGKTLDELYNNVRANSPKTVVSNTEVWIAHTDNIVKILNNAVNEGQLDPSVPANIKRALANKKLTDEDTKTIVTVTGKSLDDLYYGQAVPLAKQNKILGQQLEDKAVRQATAAMHETATKARDKIRQKQVFIAGYLKEQWSIDMDQLRTIVQANYAAARNRLNGTVPAMARLTTSDADAKIIAEGLDESFRSCIHDGDGTDHHDPKSPDADK